MPGNPGQLDSAFDILGVGPGVTHEQLEVAYQRRVHEMPARFVAEDIEWAYRQILQSQRFAPIADDGIVSAVLLPGLDSLVDDTAHPSSNPNANANANANADANLLRAHPECRPGAEDSNVIAIFRRPGATASLEQDLPGESVPSNTLALPHEAAPSGVNQAAARDDLELLLEMPQIPEVPRSILQPEDDEGVIEQILRHPGGPRDARPRTIRSVIGEGNKDVVQVGAAAARTSEGRIKINKILDSYRDPGGALLKELREALGVPLAELASRTKISERHIMALEQDNFAHLPAPVYYRGFVDTYLRYLGVMNAALVSSIVVRYQERRPAQRG